MSAPRPLGTIAVALALSLLAGPVGSLFARAPHHAAAKPLAGVPAVLPDHPAADRAGHRAVLRTLAIWAGGELRIASDAGGAWRDCPDKTQRLKHRSGLTIFRRRLQGTRGPLAAHPARQRLLGNRLTVDPRTLTPLVLVRIQVPQPNLFNDLIEHSPRGASMSRWSCGM